jgi:hypothetical protein
MRSVGATTYNGGREEPHWYHPTPMRTSDGKPNLRIDHVRPGLIDFKWKPLRYVQRVAALELNNTVKPYRDGILDPRWAGFFKDFRV